MEFTNPKTKAVFDRVTNDNPRIYVPAVAGVHGDYHGPLANIPLPVAESLEKQECYHWVSRKQVVPATGEPKQKQKPE